MDEGRWCTYGRTLVRPNGKAGVDLDLRQSGDLHGLGPAEFAGSDSKAAFGKAELSAEQVDKGGVGGALDGRRRKLHVQDAVPHARDGRAAGSWGNADGEDHASRLRRPSARRRRAAREQQESR